MRCSESWPKRGRATLGYQHDDFSTYVGDTFRVVGDHAVDWRLVSVSELRRAGDFESYSIEFETSEHDAGQGIVALEHDELGAVELFVVAVGPGRYEAVFNQLVGAQQ
jgi:hypothetical protein